MNRLTVDFGVDLGTTNSAIARATPVGAKIVKNRFQTDTTPSAVAKTVQGQILVGQDALDRRDLEPATRFKRLMGTTRGIPLADRTEMTPEQLSAEVLKELKATVQLRYETAPEYVVVTVPAMFQQPQCEATHRAAELAGLQAVTLLQEPIAAATAYLNEDPQEGDYLVYDLGGGTFDVSIVRLKENEMSVVAHGGDNFLGGSDFDARLYEWARDQIDSRLGRQPHLHEELPRYRLLRACEQAKIRLSLQEEAMIDLGDLELPIAHLTLTRTILDDLIEEYVVRTLRLTRERLEQASLSQKAIRRLLLVGGPTMMPSLRHRLRHELKLDLSLDQDPMTVVAQGAALYAASLLKPTSHTTRAVSEPTQAILELHYDPVAHERASIVSGIVVQPAGFEGELRVSRVGGDWETGWMPLKQSAFVCPVLLGAGGTTEFDIALRDRTGTIFHVAPSQFVIQYGIAAARSVTPYDYGVALDDGSFAVVIAHNQPLPAHGTASFRAAKAVPAGSNEEIPLYFLEGLNPMAAENIGVGELRIRGCDLVRTLREGEKVEVRMYMDESRRLRARVFIPVYDLDFAVEMRSILDQPPLDDLMESLKETCRSLVSIEEIVTDDDEVGVMEARRDLERTEADLVRIEQGGDVEVERVAKKLADLHVQVRVLTSKYGLQAAYHRTIESINEAQEMAELFEFIYDISAAEDLRQEAETCLRLQNERGLATVKERAEEIYWRHYAKTEECWIGFVDFLQQARPRTSDPVAYHEHLKRTERCLKEGDYAGVRLNGYEAIKLLPMTEVKKSRFCDAALRAV